jgi:hypothetical protein
MFYFFHFLHLLLTKLRFLHEFRYPLECFRTKSHIQLQSNFDIQDAKDNSNRPINLHYCVHTQFTVRFQVILQFFHYLLIDHFKLDLL